VLVGGVGENGLRVLTSLLLARVLGPLGYGLYAAASTVVQIAAALLPLGIDGGALYFGARFRQRQDRAGAKGLLQAAALVVGLLGPLGALGLYLVGRFGAERLADRPGLALALQVSAPAVLFGAVLSVAVGALQAERAVKAQVLGFQVGLPLVTLLGSLAALGMGFGVEGALGAMVLGYAVAAAACTRAVWRLHAPLLRDRAVVGRLDLGPLLRYSLPQALARTLWRANQWADVLMLTALASLDEVGIYRAAVMLASFGALPVLALSTLFNPTIAELVAAGDLRRLDALLKVVTRWLLVVSAPGYLVVLLVPDLCLLVFDEAYTLGAPALAVLMAGQAVYVACAINSALVPMSGMATLNFAQALAAFLLNLGLNAWLIPTMGQLGAAVASSVAIAAWSLWKLGTTWRLLGCFPFGRAAAGVVLSALLIGGLAWWLIGGASPAVRLGGTAVAVLAQIGAGWWFGRGPEDAMLVARIRAKLSR
jgi:O-antigen/teichoic acid export membrane protein